MVRLLSDLPDGTGVRFTRLDSTGFNYVGEVQDRQIVDPNGETRSPTGAAFEVDKTIRGADAVRGSWGPDSWDWFSGDGWEELATDR